MKEKQEGVIEENRHNQVKMLASKIGVGAERWLRKLPVLRAQRPEFGSPATVRGQAYMGHL